jgi:hypothetical protein
MWPPSGVYLAALSRRLATIWARRTGSPLSQIASDGRSRDNRCLRRSMWGVAVSTAWASTVASSSGCTSSWSLPCATRETSSRSLTIRVRCSACRATTSIECFVPSVVSAARNTALALRMTARGLRSSCPSIARNSSLWRPAASACSDAFHNCHPAEANCARERISRSSSRSNFRSSEWLTIQTVPTGSAWPRKGISNASTKRGSARRAGKHRSARCISWVALRSMQTPQGLAPRGIVPLRNEAKTPATASQRNTAPSSRLMPAVSARHRLTADSTSFCSMLRGSRAISSASPARARLSPS